MKKVQKLIQQLTMYASMGCMDKKKPVGYYIERLSKEEKELLKSAKADDFYYRWENAKKP